MKILNDYFMEFSFLFIFFILFIVFLDTDDYHEKIHRQRIAYLELQSEMDELKDELSDLKYEFMSYKDLSDKMFESNWKSLSRLNNNFKSLGLGYHLEDDDILPDPNDDDDDEE